MSDILQHQTSIDESLYSRQLYVMGKEVMHRLANAHVLISSIRSLGVEIDEMSVVSTLFNTRHSFEDGSYVTFHGVHGMTEINGREFKISVSRPSTFTIGDTRDFGVYENGGIVIEVKKAKIVVFKSFSESLLESEILICNYLNSKKKYQILPKPWNDSYAETFYEVVEQLNSQNKERLFTDDLNKHWIKLFAKSCTDREYRLVPTVAVAGMTVLYGPGGWRRTDKSEDMKRK